MCAAGTCDTVGKKLANQSNIIIQNSKRNSWAVQLHTDQSHNRFQWFRWCACAATSSGQHSEQNVSRFCFWICKAYPFSGVLRDLCTALKYVSCISGVASARQLHAKSVRLVADYVCMQVRKNRCQAFHLSITYYYLTLYAARAGLMCAEKDHKFSCVWRLQWNLLRANSCKRELLAYSSSCTEQVRCMQETISQSRKLCDESEGAAVPHLAFLQLQIDSQLMTTSTGHTGCCQ